MRNQPDFLLIGAQKCGTSWLFRQLLQHPECYLSPEKEGGYFFWSSTRNEADRDVFRREYETAGRRHRVSGEATSIYFWTRTGSVWDEHPDGSETSVPARVREELGGDVRILLSLRDPVERALSAFVHYLRSGELEFGQGLFDAGTHNGIIHMGFYARHLAHWLEYFEPERFLILNFEEHIVARPQQTLARIFRFLRIDDTFMPGNPGGVVFPGLRRRWRDHTLMATDPEGVDQPIADRSVVSELQDMYRADVESLDRMLGRDFSRSWVTLHAVS
jgi:hypothetical protein